MIYIYKDRIIRLEWTILKGTSHVKENFDRALVKLFLIGPADKYLLDATAENGVITATIPQGLPEGNYSVEVIYAKNWGNLRRGDAPTKPMDERFNDRCLMRSRKDDLFGITNYESEADNVGEGEVVVSVKSSVATYGYDGLSVYELAVMRGTFIGSESAFIALINNHVTEHFAKYVNSIQLEWNGSAYLTRISTPIQMRRKGLMISYVNGEGKAITEKCVFDADTTDVVWGLDSSWQSVEDLVLGGELFVSPNGTWVIDGVDTGINAVGMKGDNGITPLLKTIDNKLHYSYDGNAWVDAGADYIASWFRWSGNKIQISRDNKTWSDLSGEFADNLFIKGYVATYAELPTSAVQGDIWGVGPTYAADDTEHTNPIYRYYVKNASGWVDNGSFTSISAGIVQETGDGENVVMSQKAVTEKLTELEYKSYLANDGYAYVDSMNVLHIYKCGIINTQTAQIYFLGSVTEEITIQLKGWRAIIADIEKVDNTGAVPLSYIDISQGNPSRKPNNIIVYQGAGNAQSRLGLVLNDCIEATLTKIENFDLCLGGDGYAYIDEENKLHCKNVLVINKFNNQLRALIGDNSLREFVLQITRQTSYFIDARQFIKGVIEPCLLKATPESTENTPHNFGEALPVQIHIGSSDAKVSLSTMMGDLITAYKVNELSKEHKGTKISLYAPMEYGTSWYEGRLHRDVYPTLGLTRLFSAKYLKFNGRFNTQIAPSVPSDYRFKVYFYDENFTLIQMTDWSENYNQTFEVPSNTEYVKFFVKKADETICEKISVYLEFESEVHTDFYVCEIYDAMDAESKAPNGIVNVFAPFRLSNPKSCEDTTDNMQDIPRTLYANYGVLHLPKSYNNMGEKTPMIIFAHGSSTHYSNLSNEIQQIPQSAIDYYLAMGYAILDMDGNVLSTSKPHANSPMALQAYVAGYNWVVNRFNIDKQVCVMGNSQGGGFSFILANTLPTKAVCPIQPLTDIVGMFQLFAANKADFAEYFGFEGAAPSWTTSGTLHEEEKAYIYANYSKMRPFSAIHSLSADTLDSEIEDLNINYLANVSNNERDYYKNKHKLFDVPCKIFQGLQDDTIFPARTRAIATMLKNAGCICEYRELANANHYTIHELGSNAIVANDGMTYKVSTVYAEIMAFFERYRW